MAVFLATRPRNEPPIVRRADQAGDRRLATDPLVDASRRCRGPRRCPGSCPSARRGGPRGRRAVVSPGTASSAMGEVLRRNPRSPGRRSRAPRAPSACRRTHRRCPRRPPWWRSRSPIQLHRRLSSRSALRKYALIRSSVSTRSRTAWASASAPIRAAEPTAGRGRLVPGRPGAGVGPAARARARSRIRGAALRGPLLLLRVRARTRTWSCSRRSNPSSSRRPRPPVAGAFRARRSSSHRPRCRSFRPSCPDHPPAGLQAAPSAMIQRRGSVESVRCWCTGDASRG
jgi:hypothetical protein